METSIVAARDADLASVSRLLETAGLPTDDLTAGALTHFRLLRGDAGTVLGAVGLDVFGPVAMLRSLAVRDEAQGKGHGHSLVLDVEAYGRSEGVSALYLLTTTAARFFERLGYAPIDRDLVPPSVASTDAFERLCPDDATCMWKQLSRG